jgi:hypothetical protein
MKRIGMFLLCILTFTWSSTAQLVQRMQTNQAVLTKANAYQLTSEGQAYFNALSQVSWPSHSTGVFSGAWSNPNVLSSTYDQFYFEHIYTLSVPYLYSHDYGIKANCTFSVTGPINYSFNIPYSVDVDLPDTVYLGQRVFLAPAFMWGNGTDVPKVSASQNYSFSCAPSLLWLDAPDGFDAWAFGFDAQASKTHVSADIPVLPLCDALHLATDVAATPFNVSYGGSYQKLSGSGTLNNSGTIPVDLRQPNEVRVAATGVTGAAWYTGQEQFALAAFVLSKIPITAPAGLAIDFLRIVGQFQFTQQLQASIHRDDVVYLQVAELPYIDIPKYSSGPTLVIDMDVPVKFRVCYQSFFYLPISFNVAFDMIGIDKKTLLDLQLAEVNAGSALSGWIDFTPTPKIHVKGQVVVKPREQIKVQLPLLTSTTQPAKQLFTASPVPLAAGRTLATLSQTRKVFRGSKTVAIPQPTVQTGLPQAGQYTVILGHTTQATATQICDALKKKGITAFAVKVSDPPGYAITFGSFADKKAAYTLAGILGEGFKLRCNVSSTMDKKYFVPIGNEVLTKIQAI